MISFQATTGITQKGLPASPHRKVFLWLATAQTATHFIAMGKTSVDIGVNWVSWLRDHAARHYIWDETAHYFRINAPRGVTERTLRDAWNKLPAQHARFPHLHSNLFSRLLPELPLSARAHISTFFSARGLRDFEFLDHGGRAIVFRAHHYPTGQMRIARMEAPHSGRYPRPKHPVILQPFASNEGHFRFYGDVKLEILPEIFPLSKLYPEISKMEVPLLKSAFQQAVYDLSWGVNMMLSRDMFDRDAEAPNVGIRPDGRVVSFDPEIVRGPKAHEKHLHFKTPGLLRDANAQQLALVYPAV